MQRPKDPGQARQLAIQEHGRAVELMKQGRHAEAEAVMERIRPDLPMDPLLFFNFGNLYWETNRPTQAIRSYRQAISLKPDFVGALVNLSNALSIVGEKRESLRHLQMALRRTPNDSRLLCNLASLLNGMGEGPQAWEAIEKAKNIAPDDAKIALIRMSIVTDLKMTDQIEAACRHAIKTSPNSLDLQPYTNLASHFAKFSRWRELAQVNLDMQAVIDRAKTEGKRPIASPMQISFCLDDVETVRICAQEMRHNFLAFTRGKPRYVPGKDRICIGYLSPDLRQHPVAQMLVPILRQHDRSRFRICTLSTLPDDGSELGREIAKHADLHIDLSPLDDNGAAEAIRSAGVDILIDLAGATQWCRPGMLAIRPTPFQILWLGCPSTTGMSWYDAFLVDRVAVSDSYRSVCTEPLVVLPCCYHPITTGLGEPATDMTREKLGLPAGDFILGLLQLPTKIRPPFVNDLMEILRRAPQIKLWLRAEAAGMAPIRDFAKNAGVDPDRILFYPGLLPRRDYLATYTIPDLLIDSYPYGGHSTTGEALSMGCPVVTQSGECMHTRVAASMLNHLGLDELVAYDRNQFIDLVVALSTDANRLAGVRERTREAAKRVRADAGRELTRALEQVFTSIVAAATPT